MTRDLDAEIRTFLLEHGSSTVEEIALGVRVRRADVAAVLVQGDFSRSSRRIGTNPRSITWGASRPVLRSESGTDRGPSQCSRVLDVLRDGRPHTVAEIHRLAGFSRLNSRVAELRERGHVITCSHIEGAGRGPEAYEYVLHVAEAEAA